MRRGLAGITVAFLSAAAIACPLCLGVRTPAQDLIDLPRAVLAVPLADGGSYRVVDTVKGQPPDSVMEVVVRDASSKNGGRPLLLVRDEAWPMWVSLGVMDARYASTLRDLAVERPPATDAAAWLRRVDLALPHLESRETLLTEIAYAECASAPYVALRAAKPRLDVKMLRRSLDDPRLASRRSLYVLLLGIAGDARDAAAIDAQLDKAWRAHDATDLASLLAAALELRGPAGVAWLEDRYLRRTARTMAEMRAALLALTVHGDTVGAIPRERVIEAFLLFMREHREIAGLVAQELAEWQYWEATPDFAALLRSGVRQQYESHTAIVAYLRQSPLAVKAE